MHLKVDTGMSRGGATAADWPAVVDAARSAEAAGHIRIIGLWSHLACADMPGHPSIDSQVVAFREAIALAERAGARPQVRHLANTPATLTLPQTWFDLVRTGGGVFGLSTLPGGPPAWLRPAMTVGSRLIQVKQVAAGHRRVLRSPVHHHGAEHARAWSHWVMPRGTAGARSAAPGFTCADGAGSSPAPCA